MQSVKQVNADKNALVVRIHPRFAVDRQIGAFDYYSHLRWQTALSFVFHQCCLIPKGV